MLEQYFGMKARHPEAILLSRVGDFYEAYGEDAERIAHQEEDRHLRQEHGHHDRDRDRVDRVAEDDREPAGPPLPRTEKQDQAPKR